MIEGNFKPFILEEKFNVKKIDDFNFSIARGGRGR